MPNNKTRNEKKKKHEIHNNTERKISNRITMV